MRLRDAIIYICFIVTGFNGPVFADDRLVRLAVPPELADSGLMQFMLPRFSLKTQVKVQVVAPGDEAEAALGEEGIAVFSGEGATWFLSVNMSDHPGTVKFADWITSEIGQRAITGFERDGVQPFSLPVTEAAIQEDISFDGNAVEGRQLARALCGRCHVSVKGEPMIGIGSTPSFFVLRALADWPARFQTFYILNPHPAFTQIEDVTDPFPADRPPPIVPVVMSVEDLEAILAYVAALEPADLGAPLQNQ